MRKYQSSLAAYVALLGILLTAREHPCGVSSRNPTPHPAQRVFTASAWEGLRSTHAYGHPCMEVARLDCASARPSLPRAVRRPARLLNLSCRRLSPARGRVVCSD